MSGRIILHIGTHKTATTHIQRTLSANDGVLAKRGIWYPKYDIIGRSQHYSHLDAANAFAGEPKNLTRPDAIRFFQTVASRSDEYDVTILSAESFWRHIWGQEGSYWEQRRAFLQQLADLLWENVTIAVVMRPQSDFAHSFYQEHVKATRYASNFATYRKDFWFHFDYLTQLRMWQSVFPQIKAMRFSDLLQGNSLIETFGQHIGVDLSGIKPAGGHNQSWPADLTIIKRLLNTTNVDRTALRTSVGAMISRLPEWLRVQSRSLYDDEADLRRFQQSFDEDNQVLAHRFFDMLDPLFLTQIKPETVYGDCLQPSVLGALLLE